MKTVVKVLSAVVIVVAGLWLRSLYVDLMQEGRACALLDDINAAYYKGSFEGVAKNIVVHDGKRDISFSDIVRKGDSEMIRYSGGVADGVVFVRKNAETRIYKPNTKAVEVINAPDIKISHSSLLSALSSYKPRFSADSKVAGQVVSVLELTPREGFGPTKKLWVDGKHLLILKSEDRSAKGELLSSMEFLKIKYDAKISDKDFQMPAEMAKWKVQESEPVISEADAEKILGAKPAYPRVPAGYKLDGLRSFECKCLSKHKSVHVRYTNGINSISVFECPAVVACSVGNGQMKHAAGECKMMQGREASVAGKTVGRVSISVVSDLPQKELREIADSVR